MRVPLPPSQNWNAAVELILYLLYLCLVALGRTQPSAACLGVARDSLPWPGLGISKIVQNDVANGRPRR